VFLFDRYVGTPYRTGEPSGRRRSIDEVPAMASASRGTVVTGLVEGNGGRYTDRLLGLGLTPPSYERLLPRNPAEEPATVLLERIRAERAAEPQPVLRQRAAASR